MSEMNDAVQRFSNEVDAALTRARRAKADAQARAAQLRAENDRAAEQLRAGGSHDKGGREAQELRSSARGFRQDNGLPIESFPEPAAQQEPKQGEQKDSAPTDSRRGPVHEDPFDDGEDFSQTRFMR